MRIDKGKDFFKACRALCKFDKQKIHNKYELILIRNLIRINEKSKSSVFPDTYLAPENHVNYIIDGVFKYYEDTTKMQMWIFSGMEWFKLSDDFYFAFFKNLDKRIIEKFFKQK
jgi:hypothetical protein